MLPHWLTPLHKFIKLKLQTKQSNIQKTTICICSGIPVSSTVSECWDRKFLVAKL